MKIHYKTETDEKGIVVDYFIQPDPTEDRVKWMLFPNLPKGLDLRNKKQGQALKEKTVQSHLQNFASKPRTVITL